MCNTMNEDAVELHEETNKKTQRVREEFRKGRSYTLDYVLKEIG